MHQHHNTAGGGGGCGFCPAAEELWSDGTKEKLIVTAAVDLIIMSLHLGEAQRDHSC